MYTFVKVESNYETLRLHTQIGVGAYRGGRLFPPPPSHHDNRKKGAKGSQVIDYFDYVNPSELDEVVEERSECDLSEGDLEPTKVDLGVANHYGDTDVDKPRLEESESLGVVDEAHEDNTDDTDQVLVAKTVENLTTENNGVAGETKVVGEIKVIEVIKVASSAEIKTDADDRKVDKCLNNENEDTIIIEKTAETVNCVAADDEHTADVSVLRSETEILKKLPEEESKDTGKKIRLNKPKKVKRSEQKRKNCCLKKNDASISLDEGKDSLIADIQENSNNNNVNVKKCTESVSEIIINADHCQAADVDEVETIGGKNHVTDNVTENADTVAISRLHVELRTKTEYRTALEVDTSYQTGVSSDSNCSQYSVSSWTSEHDTSSSLDPSPNLWNSYIDSGISLGAGTGGIYSDTSDVSGEDCNNYESSNTHRFQSNYQQHSDGKYVQIWTRYPRNKLSYSNEYFNDDGAYSSVNIYNDSGGDTALVDYENYENYQNYQNNNVAESRELTCEFCCGYCQCPVYDGCPREPMLPGDVYYYSSNSVVVCVKQAGSDVSEIATKSDVLEITTKTEASEIVTKSDASEIMTKSDTSETTSKQVTPKSPALNPNASVFLSVKSLTPGTGATDSAQQWEANDSGIANTTSSVSDCSFVNGDTSLDKSVETGVFSPSSDTSFHQDYNTFTDNLNDNNANISTMKLDNTVGGSVILDNAGNGFNTETLVQPVSFSEVNQVPMSGIQYTSENGSITDGDVADGNSSMPDGQLRSMLKNQLESYFSRENLSNDSYLMSQMDADQYVPIATVANLDQIQRLTTDIQLIVELLRESTFVQVDEKGEKVRPNHNRCIVILREIPESTPVQDVQGLFKGANCPKFVSCEFAHNSNWYVTFDSDADAQRAYQYLREEVRTFLGNPIMARIKAKPLIRTYQPRNGYINKRYQQQPQVTPQQIQPEVVTSSAPQPQFTPTLPFTLSPNVSQYLNGQQAIPFYPPPTSQLLQTWPSPTMLDPSMVLAMNGYQATNVKVNSQVTNNSRNMFNSVNRNNNYTRNQKPGGGGGQTMGRDRINSNDSLPPRLQHQQQERQMNAANSNMHKTSQSISNHAPVYQARRADGLAPGHSSHGNHSHSIHHGNHSHSAPMSHHPHHHHQGPTQQHHQGHPPPQHQQHLDGNNNANSSSNGALLNNRHLQAPDLSRYASNKSYKGRRRREDDGARLNRSNSSQSSQREGGPVVGQQRPASDKFDYEPTSFPPLPGSGKNASSGEVFGDSKLSDVVKGTAKLLVKEVPTKPVSTVSAVSTATTTITTSIQQQQSVTSSKEVVETVVASTCTQQRSMSTPLTTSVTKVTPTVQPSSVSQTVRPSTRPVHHVPETRPSTTVESTPQQSTAPITEDITASISANSVKLSYAQMVQKTRVAEVSANSGVDPSDESETDEADTSQPPNRALKEQGQHPTQSSSKPAARGSSKDFSRKDSRDNECESRRDDRDFRKENDFRRDEPREQRMNRRAKENRERRYNDRDLGRRGDRRERDAAPPLRERDAPRTAPAASK